MLVWKVCVEKEDGAGSFRYYNQCPTVGEVVDLILYSRNVSDLDDLIKLAAKYVKHHSQENREDGAITVGHSLTDAMVTVGPYEPQDSIGLDYKRELAKAYGKDATNPFLKVPKHGEERWITVFRRGEDTKSDKDRAEKQTAF